MWVTVAFELSARTPVWPFFIDKVFAPEELLLSGSFLHRSVWTKAQSHWEYISTQFCLMWALTDVLDLYLVRLSASCCCHVIGWLDICMNEQVYRSSYESGTVIDLFCFLGVSTASTSPPGYNSSVGGAGFPSAKQTPPRSPAGLLVLPPSSLLATGVGCTHKAQKAAVWILTYLL